MRELTVAITELGAQGDGVAEVDGETVYVPYTLPGEMVAIRQGGSRGQLLYIEHASGDRVDPPCPHFGPQGQQCGGCCVQHLEVSAYRRWKWQRVADALLARGIDAQIEALVPCLPGTRRRAVFSVVATKKDVILGFHRASTHTVIGIRECAVLRPEITRALGGLQRLAAQVAGRKPFRLNVLSTASGLDVCIEGRGSLSDRQRQNAINAALETGLARLSLGDEVLIEARKPVMTIAGIDVMPPPASFFQATEAAQDTMIAAIGEFLSGTAGIADLFCGCGTFALPLAKQAAVHAVENDGPALAALAFAARHTQWLKPLTTERRDLFHSPLTAAELKKTDAVVFDPPRAGAQAQAVEIAASRVARVAAVSCNPATLGRDLRILIDGGFRLVSVTPIDQFLWSHHVEAIALLER